MTRSDRDHSAHTDTIAIVPARGGSRSLPGKNLAKVGGISLVERAVAAARDAGIDDIAVSTDSRPIGVEARRVGARDLQRPADLATDTAGLVDVVLDLTASMSSHTIVVLLQPTSPLRNGADVRSCLRAIAHAPSVATVCASDHPWQWTLELAPSGGAAPVDGWESLRKRRQDLTPGYRPNGAVYAARLEWLRRSRTFVGPETAFVVMARERSVDIDDEVDLLLAEAIEARRHS